MLHLLIEFSVLGIPQFRNDTILTMSLPLSQYGIMSIDKRRDVKSEVN